MSEFPTCPSSPSRGAGAPAPARAPSRAPAPARARAVPASGGGCCGAETYSCIVDTNLLMDNSKSALFSI